VLRVNVRDDGRGGADVTGGSGLAGLRDRVEALGGRISLHGPPGEGTTLQVQLPIGQARPWQVWRARAPHTARTRCHRSRVLTDGTFPAGILAVMPGEPGLRFLVREICYGSSRQVST
jgi:hypothetical protein